MLRGLYWWSSRAGCARIVCSQIASAGRAASATRPGGADAVLDIGDRRQVFLDDRFFAASRNVELVVHPPRKTGERTLLADRPWEDGDIGVYCCVHKVGDIYHLWYPAGPGICYARSKDGIHFEKPSLGLTEYKGSRDNNIVIGGGAAGLDKCGSEGMVFLDPTAPEDQRFRYAVRISDELKDTVVFSSPDGIHWKLTHEHVLTFTAPQKPNHLDSQNVIFWDDRIGKYVAYMRRNVKKTGPRLRTVARSESDRLGGFAEAQDAPIVLGPDEQDAKLGDANVMDYYTSGVIKYPWAQDAYYMFPQAYFHYTPRHLAEFPKDCPVNAGPLDTRFAASRDGIAWNRFDRRPFVRLGMKGEFDSKCARVFYGLVPSVDGREMYQYYLGSDQLHGWSTVDPNQPPNERARAERNNRLLTAAGLAPTANTSIVSRLVSRRDGFVSVRAAYAGGEFTTPPLKFAGRELVLNVDTSAAGLLRCELLDEQSRPIEGYRLDQCDLIHTTNEIDRRVSWSGKSDVSTLAGRPVRLRIAFRDTDIYAFQFRP